jgi:hypothetical protein
MAVTEHWSAGVLECWKCVGFAANGVTVAPGSAFLVKLTRAYGRRMQFARRPTLQHSSTLQARQQMKYPTESPACLALVDRPNGFVVPWHASESYQHPNSYGN